MAMKSGVNVDDNKFCKSFETFSYLRVSVIGHLGIGLP
jgi:hypothetical protein